MPTIRRCYLYPEIVLERTQKCASVRLDSWSNYFAYPSTLPTVELESRIANCRSVDSRLNTEQRCWLGPFRPARVYESPNQLQLRKHSSAQHKTRSGTEKEEKKSLQLISRPQMSSTQNSTYPRLRLLAHLHLNFCRKLPKARVILLWMCTLQLSVTSKTPKTQQISH